MVTEIRIRRARPDEAGELTRIAHAAKRYWGYPEEWIELWATELTVTPAFIESSPVYVAERVETVLGLYALSGKPPELELEHAWVDPNHLRRGVGRLLLEHAAATTRDLGGRALLIASDPNAESFYLKMGAERIGDVPSNPEGRTLPLLRLPCPP